MYYYTRNGGRNGEYSTVGMTKDGSFTPFKSEWVKFTESEKLSIGLAKPHKAQGDGDFVKCIFYK